MGMSISATNYFSDLQQSTCASSEKKETSVDVGKTRQSSVSASLDQVNMGQDGVAVTEVSRQQGAEQSDTQKRPAAPRMDRVEISPEGQAKLQTQRTGASPAEAEQYETEDLSEYTDTELKQMYYKGEITRQEYEKETGKTLESQ